VTGSEEDTRRLPDTGPPGEPPLATIGAVELRAANGLLDGVDLSQHDGVALALQALLAAVPPQGSLALRADLDPELDARVAELRVALTRRTGHAVTFAWGPRWPHPTGGSPEEDLQAAALLHLTDDAPEGPPADERPSPTGTSQGARAAAERQAVAERQRPLLHLHLTDRAAGIGQLLDALG
jgi:hypothetical protein